MTDINLPLKTYVVYLVTPIPLISLENDCIKVATVFSINTFMCLFLKWQIYDFISKKEIVL